MESIIEYAEKYKQLEMKFENVTKENEKLTIILNNIIHKCKGTIVLVDIIKTLQ